MINPFWQYSVEDQEDECEEQCQSKDALKSEAKAKSNFDGAQCFKCKDYFYLAEANQPDGETFVCRACKLNPWRSSPINPDD
jgi:hypothetical protein